MCFEYISVYVGKVLFHHVDTSLVNELDFRSTSQHLSLKLSFKIWINATRDLTWYFFVCFFSSSFFLSFFHILSSFAVYANWSRELDISENPFQSLESYTIHFLFIYFFGFNANQWLIWLWLMITPTKEIWNMRNRQLFRIRILLSMYWIFCLHKCVIIIIDDYSMKNCGNIHKMHGIFVIWFHYIIPSASGTQMKNCKC